MSAWAHFAKEHCGRARYRKCFNNFAVFVLHTAECSWFSFQEEHLHHTFETFILDRYVNVPLCIPFHDIRCKISYQYTGLSPLRMEILPVRPRARFQYSISASRAVLEKAVRPLLGTRTAPCDAILEDSVAFKHPSYLQPETQMQTTYYVQICVTYFVQTSYSECSWIV